jgi:hypothetical protein
MPAISTCRTWKLKMLTTRPRKSRRPVLSHEWKKPQPRTTSPRPSRKGRQPANVRSTGTLWRAGTGRNRAEQAAIQPNGELVRDVAVDAATEERAEAEVGATATTVRDDRANEASVQQKNGRRVRRSRAGPHGLKKDVPRKGRLSGVRVARKTPHRPNGKRGAGEPIRLDGEAQRPVAERSVVPTNGRKKSTVTFWMS